MVFVIVGQATPPRERTLDVISIHILSTDEISWIHFHLKPFHLDSRRFANMVKKSMVVNSKLTKWLKNFNFPKLIIGFDSSKLGVDFGSLELNVINSNFASMGFSFKVKFEKI